jgi:hypothetical protein
MHDELPKKYLLSLQNIVRFILHGKTFIDSELNQLSY